MRTPLLVALLALALALPAAADTVRLKNGRAYEDVIAERTSEGVRIQLAFGHIVIPDSQVASVETAPSSLAEYLKRRAELESRTDVHPFEWLDLARWAKAHDLPTASRQAAVLAADLDPKLPGLEPMLKPLGLVFDDTLARWIPYDEMMARHGLVKFDGEWVSREDKRERLAALERQRQADEEAAASRRMAAAAERMEQVQLAQMERDAYARENPPFPQYSGDYYGSIATYPGYWYPGVSQFPNGGGRFPIFPVNGYSHLIARQPGTFLGPQFMGPQFLGQQQFIAPHLGPRLGPQTNSITPPAAVVTPHRMHPTGG